MAVSDDDGWTIATFKEYVDGLLRERDAQYSRRLEALELDIRGLSDLKQSIQSARDAIAAMDRLITTIQKATQTASDKAEKAQELRNEVSNEFRSTIADTTAMMMPRTEVTALLDGLRNELIASVASLTEAVQKADETLRSEMDRRLEQIVERQRTESARADKTEGVSIGKAAAMAGVIAVIFLILAVLGFFGIQAALT